jgi:hypothetical protein
VTRQDVLQAALALPEEERARLLEEIAESLEAEVDDEFVAILNERAAAADRGEPGIPAEQVFAELRRR